MKKLILILIFLSAFISFLGISLEDVKAQIIGAPSPCINDPVNFGVEKMLLPLAFQCGAFNTTQGRYCGRGARPGGDYGAKLGCYTPTQIVMHTTQGITDAVGTYRFFANGGSNNGTGSHFTVGQDGKIIQMVEMGGTQVEFSQTVGGITDHISIEMGSPTGANKNYSSKNAAPAPQYQATLRLVKALMAQYNIPLNRVVSHESLGGGGGDPGEGWMDDFKRDLPGASPLDTTGGSTTNTNEGGSATDVSCVITQVGEPTEDKPPLPPECLASSTGGTVIGGGQPGPCGQAPAPPSNIAQVISNRWDITLNNIPRSQQEAIWEEFHEIDCTGILQDLRGAVIDGTGAPGGGSSQNGFGVLLAVYDKQFTKGLVLHELTHVWQTRTPRGEANVFKIPAAFQAEGGISKYSRNECNFLKVGDNWRNEDHADTIALYLNPGIGELTCGGGAPNPFASGRYPQHSNIAKEASGR